MSGIVPSKTSILALLVLLLAYLASPPVNRVLTVLGIWRQPFQTLLADEKTDLVIIKDTVHCEDLHYHAPSHTIFTACEDTAETRFKWFPPLAVFDDPTVLETNRGSVHVIDPETKRSTRLAFQGFSGPFCTHGIDVLPDPARPYGQAVYIYAVNHLPNPDFPWNGTREAQAQAAAAKTPKARSRIEIFHHVLGAATAVHVRSVEHPLLHTPNDLIAVHPGQFYVTNDHRHREGFLRSFEEIVPAARWTDIVRVDLDASPDEGVTASVALDRLHAVNGLGHGPVPHQLLATSCPSGVLRILQASPGTAPLRELATVRVDSVVDNPSYFADPFAAVHDADDRSGYVLPGLSQAYQLADTHRDPAATNGVMVWLAQPQQHGGNATGPADAKPTARLLFADDGSRIRTASAGVLLAIDPAREGGQRKGWLYVTGFLSANTIAVKVDL